MNHNSALKYRIFQHFFGSIFLLFTLMPNHMLGQCGTTYISGTGSKTWTAPADITSSVTVQAWGAGGGGRTGSGGNAGGGGGGGAYASSTVAVTPSTGYTVVIGAGGGSTVNGGSSSFGAGTVVAAGGTAGTQSGSNYTGGGAGGTVAASTGTIKYAGGNGGGAGNDDGPGGGGGAGTTANGSNGANAGATSGIGVGGAGGVTGGGDGGDGGVDAGGCAKCGKPVGGGGGGGGEQASCGGVGGDGQVILTYTTTACPSGITLIYGGVATTTSMTSASTKTICSGSSVSLALTGSTSYKWLATANANVTGESTTTQTSSTINNTLTNSTSAVQTVTYTVTPASSCTSVGIAQVVSITVNPLPTMTSASTATICSGTAVSIPLTATTSTTTATTFTWIASSNANVTGESTTSQATSTLSNTLTNTTTSIQTVTYTVTPTNSCGAGTKQVVNVTVNPAPTMTSASTATICSGGTLSISLGANLASDFSWIATDNGNTTGESTTSQSTSTLSNTITNSTGSVQTVSYTVTPTSNPGGCVGTGQVVSVTVNSQPTASAGGSQTICVGSDANVSGASSSNGTILWSENGAGSITSGITSLTPTYTSAAGDIGNTVTLTMTVSNSPCTDATATYSVFVNSGPTAAAGGSQTICVGSTATVSGASSSNGTILWTENGAGTITSGGTTLTPVYTSAAGDAGNTVTLTMTVSNSPCTDATATYSVVVKAQPTAASGGSQTICVGSNATVSGASSSNGTILWTENGAGTITSGATTLTPVYTSAAGDAGTTVTLTMTVSNSPCTDATATYSVVVKATPTAASGGSQTICSGSTATVSGASSGNGTILWTENGVGTITSGATTLTPVYSSAAGDAGTTVTTVTLTMTVSNSPCSDATATYDVIVNPLPQGSLIGNTRCGGDDSSFGQLTWTATAGTDVYTVEYAPGSQASVTSGIPWNLPVGTPTADSVFVLTKVTDANGCIRTSGFTVGTATVVVTGSAIVITNNTPASTTVCAGTTASFNVIASNVNSYTWEESTDGGTVFTLINAPGAGPVYSNYTTSTLLVDNATVAHTGYKYRAVLIPACGANAISDTAELTINPVPVLSSGTGNIATLCSGDTYTYTPTSDPGSSFSWTRPTVAGITPVGTTSAGSVSEVLTNSTTLPINVTYDYVTTSSDGCSNSGENVIVTVNPDATIDLTSSPGTDNQYVCLNQVITTITYSVNAGATGATSSNLPAGVTGSFNAGTGIYTISGTPSIDGVYDYTVTTTGTCIQTNTTGKITVGLSLSSAAGTDNQAVCKNSPITPITYAVGSSSAIVSATLPAGVTGSFNSGTQEFTISGTPSIEGTYTYTVSTNGTCSTQSSATGILTVGLGLVTPGTDTQSVCKNSPIVDIVYNIVGGGTPSITGLPAGVSGSLASASVFTISGTPSVEGTFRYTITTTGSCTPQSSLSGMLTVGLGLVTPGTDTQSVCKNSPIVDIVYNIVGGGTPTITGLPAGVSGSLTSTSVFTISGTPSIEGTFRYTITTTGTCTPQSSLSGMLTVGLGLVTPGTDTQSVCKNSPITDIVYNFVGGGTPTIIGLPAGVSGTLTSASEFTISGTPSIEGTYRYTISTSGICNSQSSLSGLITVGVGLVTPGTDTQSVCKSSPIVDIVYNIAGGGIPTVTGLPAGVSGSLTSASVFTISGTPSVEGTYRYTITTTGSCNPQSTLSGMLTIGLGLVTPGTDTQSVCTNTAITDIVYNFVGGGTPTVTGLPAGVTGNLTSASIFTISGTAVTEGTYRYTLSTTGSCNPQSSLSGMLTIGIGLVTPGTDTQSVCKNIPITDIEYTIVGGGTPTITGLPSGVTGSLTSASVFTISGTPSVEGTYNYTITTTGSCNPQSSLSGILTIGLGLVTSGTDTQRVCKNVAITDIVYNIVGGGAPTVIGFLPAGIASNYNAGTQQFTISGTPSVEGTYDFTVTTTGSCATQSSLIGTITVGLGLPDDTTNIQAVCLNTAITDIKYDVVGGGTPTVVGSLPPGLTTNFNVGTNIFTISGIPIIEGTYDYTVTTTGSCTDKSSLTGSITVGLGLVTKGTDTQSVCKSTPITDIVYNIVGGGTPTVVGLPAGVAGILTSPGVFTIGGTPSIEGTFNYTVTTTGSCAIPSSLTGLITVGISSPVNNNNIQNVCKNSAIADIVFNFVGGGTPTVTGLTGSGLTGAVTTVGDPGVFTISGTGTLEGIYVYTVATATTVACPTQSTFTGTITVGGGLLPTGGSNIQDICKNSTIVPIDYSIIGGGTPTVTGLTGSGLSGAVTTVGDPGVFTISGTGTLEGIYVYTVATATTVACPTQSTFTGTITVGGGLILPGGSNIQDICKNSTIVPIDYSIIGGGTPTVTGLTGSGLTGAVTTVGDPGVFTISGTGTLEGIYVYTVATATTVACPTQSTFTGTITVGGGLLPTGGSNIQDICKNSTIVPIDYSIIGGGTPTVTGLTGSGLSGAVTTVGDPGVFTISGTGTLEGIYVYTVATATTVACPTQSTFTGTITVGGGLILPGGNNVQTICRSAALTPIEYKIIGTSATVIGLPGGITNAMTTAGSPGVFTISGTPTVAGVFAYTVTTVGTCLVASSFTGTLTVDEAIATLSVAGTNVQTVCSNNTIADIVYTISGTGTGATVSTLPTGLSSSYNNGAFTISGTPNLPEGVYTFTVTPTGGTCLPSPATFMITITNPRAEFTTDIDKGSPPLVVNFTNTSQNANTYSWSFGDGTTSSAFDTSYTYVTKGVYTVQLIASSNSQCPDTATALVTVYKIVIPNVFTPNGDHVNDVFEIEATGVETIDVEVYNRWGTKIYEWHAPGGYWDGINNITGAPSEDGTYYYIIKSIDITGKAYDETGFVTLIR